MRVRLLNAFAWTLLGKFGQQLSGLLVGALLTRALGPSGRGIFAEIQTWIGVSVALFGCSFDVAVYHFANRERYPVSDGVRLTLVTAISALAGVIGGATMVCFAALMPEKLSSEATSSMPLMVAAVVATLLALNLTTL